MPRLHRSRVAPLASCAAAAALALSPPAARAADEVEVVERYVAAVNRADMAAALASFTDDARLVAGPECTERAPCVGKAQIRAKFLEPMFAQRLRLRPMLANVGPPGAVRVQLALDLDEFRRSGYPWLRGVDEFRLRGGRIASVLFRFDPSHAPTAEFLERMAEIEKARASSSPTAAR